VIAETPRLSLRRFTSDDLEHLVELDGDPQVMRFITGGRATSREELRDDVLPAWLAYYERSDAYGFWAIEERGSGAFLGWVHFRPRPDGSADDEPELGYRLRREAWGNGYAVEASTAVIDRGFRDFGVRRVVAETMAVNRTSRRVMEKCGLRLACQFHAPWPDKIPGDEHGDVEYAITHDEWKAARP